MINPITLTLPALLRFPQQAESVPDIRGLLQRLHRNGSVIKARVAKEILPGRYIISMAGYPFLAESDLKLKRGQILRVQVRSLRDGVQLQIVPEKNIEESASLQREAMPSAQLDGTAILYLSLPETGELPIVRSLYHPKKQAGGKKQRLTNLTIAVENGSNPETEIRLTFHEQSLSVQFHVNDPEWLAVLQEDFEQLRQELQRALPEIHLNLSAFFHHPGKAEPGLRASRSGLDIRA